MLGHRALRVLFLNHNQEDLGTYFRCLDLGRGLVQLGHSVTLVCASKHPTRHVSTREVDGVTLVLLPRLDWNSTFKRSIDNALRGVAAIGVVQKERFDIIHSFAVALPATAVPTIWSLLFKSGVKIIDWDDWWGRGGIGRFWGEPIHGLMTFFEEKIPLWADAVTVTNDCLKERALGLGIRPDKIRKIPNGARVDWIKPVPKEETKKALGLDPRQKVVLFEGGALIPVEAIKLLVQAFQVVGETRDDVKLVFLGRNRPEIQELVTQFGIEKETIITGWVSSEDFALYMGSADVLALPLANDVIERGRWPGRFGDYLAAGRPIVATDIGDMGAILRQEGCGLVVKPDDYEEFAIKTLALIKDEGLAQRLGRNARTFAEKNTWTKISKDLDEVYQTLAGRR